MKRLIILMTIVLITILSGCGQQSQKSKQTAGTEKDSTIGEDDYKKVFGNAKVETIRAELEDGRPWAQLAVSDKGEIFGFAPASNGKSCEIIVYNLGTHHVESFYSIKDELQPVFFKYNDDYLLWTEAISKYDVRASRIVLFDRKSKKSTILHENKKIPMEVPDEYVSLGKNYVLWSEGILDKDVVKYKISKYDIESKKTSTFREDTTMPAIGDNFIAWLAPDNKERENSAVYLNSLKDGSITKLTEDKNPTNIQTNGNSLVYSGFDDLKYLDKTTKDANNSLHSLILYENGHSKTIQKSAYDCFEFPQISNNFVGWRGTDKLRVYYKKANKIAILSEDHANYADIKVSNKYIVWNSPAIKDDNEAKKKAMQQGIYLSDIHVIKVDD